MRLASVTQVGVGQSQALITDLYSPSPVKGLQTTVTGTVTYTIEVTNSNLFDSTVVPVWVAAGKANDPMFNSNISEYLSLSAPVFAFRINQTAGSGTTKLTLAQQSIL